LKYKVTFRQRFDAEGEISDAPESLVAAPDGVVLDAVFVERIEPPSMHVEEQMEEDDNFLAFGTSTWVYEIADGKDEEFLNALAETERVLFVEKLEQTPELMM
jgi:hypothetical protein